MWFHYHSKASNVLLLRVVVCCTLAFRNTCLLLHCILLPKSVSYRVGESCNPYQPETSVGSGSSALPSYSSRM